MSPIRPRRDVMQPPTHEPRSFTSQYQFAMYAEFCFVRREVRREAQEEANLAYDAWRCEPTRDAYVVYRAAQDRADAAQDALAAWAGRVVV